MDTLLVERADGVVTLTINRPDKKNAMRGSDWARLGDLLVEIAERPDDRVLVLTGAGGDFCAGADLSSAEPEATHGVARMRVVSRAAAALYGMTKPTIAKLDGVAVGAGANMALCCDLVVASERARFSEIFARRGLSLDFGGSWLLPRIVGMQKAKELAFLADIVDAPTALGLGLVNRVVPVSELDAFVADWAARLAAGPPIALSMTKALLDASPSLSFPQALEAEAHAQTINFASQDTNEAMRAFVEKRSPVFTGR
jgi:2-(1,2-epoxy-1,2-dihydrophenyl)acetyl-CoA isomerase